MKTGLYKSISFDAYCDIDAVNQSRVKPYLISAQHGKNAEDFPDTGTPEMDLGHIAHAVILEPARLDTDYAIAPRIEGSKLKKENRKILDDHAEANKNKIIVDPDDFDAARRMCESVRAHPTASELLKGQREIVGIWKDGETGLLCKLRADLIGTFEGFGFIADVKTYGSGRGARSADGRYHQFQSDIERFGYHFQAAAYVEGVNAARGKESHLRYFFIVVETFPPYAVQVFELDQASIDLGTKLWHEALRLYAKCKETNVYPGYGNGYKQIGVPGWRLQQEMSVANG